MSNKTVVEYVIAELKSYKQNRALLRLAELDEPRIEAARLKDTPRSVTNKFSSQTENQALHKPERMELEKQVKQVEAWIGSLFAEERFVIECFYFEGLTYIQIARRYSSNDNLYHSATWKDKRKQALNKICELVQKNRD